MTNYKNSSTRGFLLLALFAIIVYHIIEGRDTTVQILAGMVLSVWLLAAYSWFRRD